MTQRDQSHDEYTCALKGDFLDGVRAIWERVKEAIKLYLNKMLRKLNHLIVIAEDCVKHTAKHEHNKYTRGTWLTIRDTRRKSQVINNRPSVSVRKIIR